MGESFPYNYRRYKVQLIDNTQNLQPQVATPTSCRVSLSHLMTYITELVRKLSVEGIVASFFKNQRKQFTNQLTNSINNSEKRKITDNKRDKSLF